MTAVAPFPTTTSVDGEHVATVYRYAARKGAIEAIDATAADLGISVSEVHEAVMSLVESRLLRAEQRVDEPAGRRFVPVDPEVAAASLVSSVEREIYQRRDLIDRIRERLDVFRDDYASTGTPASTHTSIEYLVGSAEVRGFLKVASEACRDEVLVLQPNQAGAEDLSQAYLPLLGRGITVRIICQHRNRADLSTRTQLKKLTDAGASVRTVSHMPRAAAVFDRSAAVLFGPTGNETHVARVHNHGVVQFLLDLFDHLWDEAAPLEGAESGYADVADDLRQTIAGLMANGYTDEVIARKLGMSVRTCRRHIAALMRDLEAISRFQAGVRAAHRSLVNGAA